MITKRTDAAVTLNLPEPLEPQAASSMTHSNSAEEGWRTDWENSGDGSLSKRRVRVERRRMKGKYGNLLSPSSSHRRKHVLTHTHVEFTGVEREWW